MVDDTKPEPEKTSYDWFLADVLNLSIDVTPELEAMLLVRAREYLAVTGGLPPWDQGKSWIMLGDASRKAFEKAYSELQIAAAIKPQ